jgi:hypothetical protein
MVNDDKNTGQVVDRVEPQSESSDFQGIGLLHAPIQVLDVCPVCFGEDGIVESPQGRTLIKI